jgi:putative nucleotidyltransferase with HDIG domain
MLAHRAEDAVRFTRGDAGRLLLAAVLLVVSLTAILASDIFPQRVDLQVGDLVQQDIRAPRTLTVTSGIQTAAARQAARDAVEPVYDYTSERAIAVASEQLAAFRRSIAPIETAFSDLTTPEQRQAILQLAIPGLSVDARATLLQLDAGRWAAVREEAARVLDSTERAELRDTDVAFERTRLADRMAGGLSDAERQLAAELIGPLVVPNSSYSAVLTEQDRDRQAALVEPVTSSFIQGEVIVRSGTRLTDVDLEAIQAFGLTTATPDVASLGGWFVLSALLVGLLLGWIWRFRRDFWHRNNVLLLIGLLLIVSTLALKLVGGRATLPFVIPTAAVAILVTILLDSVTATVVIAILALIGGAANGPSLEIAAYIFLGGLAGILAIRRGDRLQAFVQAGIAVLVVNVAVVGAFSLLGERDLPGFLQLTGASALAAGGSTVAAVGSFAVLGNLFGILTVFQLLELANPSQPLLRRLLVETPGTYHHSLMVGNLAERAAEAIGADPLLTRVASYYHDIGKLKNPRAFIENQAGGENIHDELAPEESAALLKRHVADGIDLAYQSRLPKVLIAFIPQHHGTAVMSYFLAKAKELAAARHGGPTMAAGPPTRSTSAGSATPDPSRSRARPP